jgi:predicted phosphodiesterase
MLKRGITAILLLGLLASCGKCGDTVLSVVPPLVISPSQDYNCLIDSIQQNGVPDTGFSFVVLGDSRGDLDMAKNVLGRALQENPLFVLHTGDIVSNGTASEYVQYQMKLVDLAKPVPVIPVAGNHESGPLDDFAAFEKVYGGYQFSFDYGECRFVGIRNDEDSGVSTDDLTYLQNELGKPGGKYRFVLMHVPPIYVTNLVASEDGRGFTKHQDEFKSLMKTMNVNIVFLGHIHGLEATIIDGVAYTITGGGGAPLPSRLNNNGNVHNFIVVRVTTDNISEEAYILNGDAWERRF